jgi:hypothetical protein
MLIKQHIKFFPFFKGSLKHQRVLNSPFQTIILYKFSESPKLDEYDPLSIKFPNEMPPSERLDKIFPSDEKMTNKIYRNTTIFLNKKIDVPGFLSYKRYFVATIAFWIALGGLSFAYLHPLAALIPSWFASGNMLSFYLSTSFAMKLIYKIDLDNELGNKVNLFAILRKKPLEIFVRDIKITQVEKVTDKEEVYIVKFNAKDKNGKQIKDAKIFFPVNIFIENNELFKNILLGNEEEVKNWKLEIEQKDEK